MEFKLSKSQVDKLGERLRDNESIAPDDMRLLDAYRRTFTPVYDEIIQKLESFGFSPSGRQAKSTTAIIDKLRRESIRLSQIQDIAGCRIVVQNIEEQEKTIETLKFILKLPNDSIKDRRFKPSHGYRAVHIVFERAKKSIELQIRTRMQHLWAENSERTSDVYGQSLKYGIGNEDVLNDLMKASQLARTFEEDELNLFLYKQIESALKLQTEIRKDGIAMYLYSEMKEKNEEQQKREQDNAYLKELFLLMLESNAKRRIK